MLLNSSNVCAIFVLCWSYIISMSSTYLLYAIISLVLKIGYIYIYVPYTV
jgi:hypothetical protein